MRLPKATYANASLSRVVALYLPQFHPIPENDAWWGPGFTEWTNVTRARPLFPGHRQPRTPADLGFCDLRVPEVREAQAALARESGIEAFCYYHYWFEGRQLLERPFAEVLASGRPDFPFCLAWANESWSRRWLGEDRDILIRQTYSAEDDVAHARWLVRAFADPRYLRVNGRPLFLVWRPQDLPDARRTTERLRDECARAGLHDPWLVGIDAHCRGLDTRALGFDDTLVFTPQLGLLPGAFDDLATPARLLRNLRAGVLSATLKLYDYEFVRRKTEATRPAFPHLPCVFPGWDNTPRRGRKAIAIVNGSPAKFAKTLEDAARVVRSRKPDERLLFVNAWNEWAEGAYLEPDLDTGGAYLRTIAEFTSRGRRRDGTASSSS
jgi:lipopolysaccharide biosynthesis protein